MSITGIQSLRKSQPALFNEVSRVRLPSYLPSRYKKSQGLLSVNDGTLATNGLSSISQSTYSLAVSVWYNSQTSGINIKFALFII